MRQKSSRLRHVIFYLVLNLLLYSLAPQLSSADTIYLENGGSVDGIIKSEDDRTVELEIGFGTISFGRAEIKDITRSTSSEKEAMRDSWAKKTAQLESKKEEFDAAREKRFAEYSEWVREMKARSLRSKSGREIELRQDPRSKSILVDVLLNNKVKADLILDTGASLVTLSRKIGEELGVDLADQKKDIVTLHLAGGRTIPAKMFLLKNLSVQGVEVTDVMAAVLMEEEKGAGAKYGLLGMTFLNRFNLKIDLKNKKLVLEKIS